MIKFLYKTLFAFSVLLIMAFVIKKTQPDSIKIGPDFLNSESRWVDSVFASLNSDQRLAQLFMVAVGCIFAEPQALLKGAIVTVGGFLTVTTWVVVCAGVQELLIVNFIEYVPDSVKL